MLYPVLPLFLTRQLGAPASVVGVIEGVAQATQNVVQGFSGWAADRLRRNKPVALVGYGLAAMAKPVIGLATAWPQVLTARFADRLGTGIRSAPRDALIAGAAGDANRGAAFGLEGVGDNLGAVAGPLVAAGLLYLAHIELRAIFFIAFIPGAIAFLLLSRVPEAPPPARRAPRIDLRALPAGYWRYLAAIAAFGIGSSSSAFIILKAADVGLAAESTLFIYAAVNLIAALASYPAGELSDVWGRKRVLLAAIAIFGIAYVGLALATAPWAVAMLFVFYGSFQGAFRAVGKALSVDLAPAALRASAVGLYSTAVGLSGLVAGIIGGQLWDRSGPSATFAYGAATAALGIVLLATIVPTPARERRRP
jgi:MFS family permease